MEDIESIKHRLLYLEKQSIEQEKCILVLLDIIDKHTASLFMIRDLLDNKQDKPKPVNLKDTHEGNWFEEYLNNKHKKK